MDFDITVTREKLLAACKKASEELGVADRADKAFNAAWTSLLLRKSGELGSLPEGLSWPTSDFVKSVPEYGKKGGFARYYNRVWAALVPFIDMRTLSKHYPKTVSGIYNHRKELSPNALPLVVEKVNDQAVEHLIWGSEDAPHLSATSYLRRIKKRDHEL
jgi:hypothetical protein